MEIKKIFKFAKIILCFIYVFNTFNLSFASQEVNTLTLRVPLAVSKEIKRQILKDNSEKLVRRLKYKALVPVATPLDEKNNIIEKDFKRSIERMARAGIRNFFVAGSSGNLKNLRPEQVTQLIRLVREVMEKKLKIKREDYIVTAGVRGRQPKKTLPYILAAKDANALVATHQNYVVSDEEMEEEEKSGTAPMKDTVRHFTQVLRLSEKEDIYLPVFFYSISGASEGKRFIATEVEKLMEEPATALIKISEQDMAYFAEISDLGIPTALGFVGCEGALTGGEVTNPVDGKKVFIKKPAQVIIPIDVNVNPAEYHTLEGLLKQFNEAKTPKKKEEKENARQKILSMQRKLTKVTHPVRYGNKEGIDYPHLVVGVNWSLILLGVFRECYIPSDTPEWLKQRIKYELMMDEQELMYYEIENKPQASLFIEEATDWVSKNLPLLGDMSDIEAVTFADNLRNNIEKAFSFREGKSKILARVIVHRGEIIIKVNYKDRGVDRELEYRMARLPKREIMEAERHLTKFVEQVRSRASKSGV